MTSPQEKLLAKILYRLLGIHIAIICGVLLQFVTLILLLDVFGKLPK